MIMRLRPTCLSMRFGWSESTHRTMSFGCMAMMLTPAMRFICLLTCSACGSTVPATCIMRLSTCASTLRCTRPLSVGSYRRIIPIRDACTWLAICAAITMTYTVMAGCRRLRHITATAPTRRLRYLRITCVLHRRLLPCLHPLGRQVLSIRR